MEEKPAVNKPEAKKESVSITVASPPVTLGVQFLSSWRGTNIQLSACWGSELATSSWLGIPREFENACDALQYMLEYLAHPGVSFKDWREDKVSSQHPGEETQRELFEWGKRCYVALEAALTSAHLETAIGDIEDWIENQRNQIQPNP